MKQQEVPPMLPLAVLAVRATAAAGAEQLGSLLCSLSLAAAQAPSSSPALRLLPSPPLLAAAGPP